MFLRSPTPIAWHKEATILPPGSLTRLHTQRLHPVLLPAKSWHLVSFNHTDTCLHPSLEARLAALLCILPTPRVTSAFALSTAMNCFQRLHDPIYTARSKPPTHKFSCHTLRLVLHTPGKLPARLSVIRFTTRPDHQPLMLISFFLSPWPTGRPPQGNFFQYSQTYVDRTSFFNHEIVPGLVILPNLNPHFGYDLLCPPRLVPEKELKREQR